MQAKQMEAMLEVLAVLGTVAGLVASAAVIGGTKLIGEERLARSVTFVSGWLFGGWGLARKVAIAALALLAAYSTALLATSFASHDWTLAPGEQKYFCEVDCHLAYSVTNVEKAKSLNAGGNTINAQGTFYVVTVRTWFDERTISPHRGDAPLEPSPKALTVVDDQGRQFAISSEGQRALDAARRSGTPITTPLRPGESYAARFAFDVPSEARNPRLLILSPSMPTWFGRIAIGDEESFFHKKVFMRLAA